MSIFDIFKPQAPGLARSFSNGRPADDVSISMAGDPAAIASYLLQQQRQDKQTTPRK